MCVGVGGGGLPVPVPVSESEENTKELKSNSRYQKPSHTIQGQPIEWSN
jgi:hypothetical protein